MIFARIDQLLDACERNRVSFLDACERNHALFRLRIRPRPGDLSTSTTDDRECIWQHPRTRMRRSLLCPRLTRQRSMPRRGYSQASRIGQLMRMGGERVADSPTLLIVDGANVVGSVPDGWWRDRRGAAVRLRDRLRPMAADGLPADRAGSTARGCPGRGGRCAWGSVPPRGAGGRGASLRRRHDRGPGARELPAPSRRRRDLRPGTARSGTGAWRLRAGRKPPAHPSLSRRSRLDVSSRAVYPVALRAYGEERLVRSAINRR